MNFDIAQILLMIVPMVLAITLHEAAHAYAARHYGDHTAEQLGRLTLNPIAHIDPVGTIAVPLVTFLLSSSMGGGIFFGWAKPVPVISRNFRDVRIGMRMTAIAGPLSNIAMMFMWGALMAAVPYLPETIQHPLRMMCWYGMSFNAILFALNMLPILPLDGGRFVDTFLPPRASMQFSKMEAYGMWIILFLVMTGLLFYILYPVMNFLLGIVATLFGLR